jgi:hypothetical protein
MTSAVGVELTGREHLVLLARLLGFGRRAVFAPLTMRLYRGER